MRLGGLLLALLLLAVPALAGCDHDVDIHPPSSATDTTAQRADQAQVALERLRHALQDGSRADAVALAAPGAGDVLAHVADNAAALHIGDLSMRYVDEAAPLNDSDQARFGKGAWRASVQLAYRYDGLDRGDAHLETSAVFVPTSHGVRIASFGDPGSRSPLWLVDRLSVVRTDKTLVAVAGGPAGRYPALVARARTQVRHVLPDWNGALLVEVPATRAELDAAVQAQPGQYDNIAAVTTTADGSLAPDSPVRVFINPEVFGDLKQRGAQVVMSHEATHVATGATFATMPTWLLEGFADFVALDGAGVPVGLAAGQILTRIRQHGLPRGLPTSQDLDPTANGLGATYEEAWLACRFLAQEYGTDKLVTFYRTVSNGDPAAKAFRSVLGTTQDEFVAKWREDLSGLARVAR